MFVKIDFLILCVYGLTFCGCFNDDWSIYENNFKSGSREEIFVANATTNPSFKLNFTVDRWKTLTVGRTCYTGGITNNSMLVILFSTLEEDGSRMIITPKTFDLQIAASDFEFFHTRKNGKEKMMIAAYDPDNKEFLLYTLDYYFLSKIGNWSLGKDVFHFSLFKMENRNMFYAITKDNFESYAADIYEFRIEPVEHRFYQSISLLHAANSSCLSTVDTVFYLSISQTPLNQLHIYQFTGNFFTSYQNLYTPKIDQVVCFENGFKSFIAFNGLKAGIYEITEDGLERETIADSNLEGIQFWLPIPVNTYRDETILLCQRQLDHETHFSLNVDVVTYNGNRFEEHEDIPCLLFGEKQNGLKCLTDYDHKRGILGSSYISVADHLSLVVPVTNSTSMLFDLHVGIRKVEHPAKKEFGSYLDLKSMLQSMIEDQNKEEASLMEQHKKIVEPNTIIEKNSQLKTPDSPPRASLRIKTNAKIIKLRDEIEQVVRDIENLSNEAGHRNAFAQKKNKYEKIVFNGPVEIVGELHSERVNSSLIGHKNAEDLINDIVRKEQSRPIEGHKTFDDLTVNDANFKNVNGLPSNIFVSNNNHEVQIDGNLIFENLVQSENILASLKLVNDIDITENWINFDHNIEGPLEFQQLTASKAFDSKILIGQENTDLANYSMVSDESSGNNQHESIFISGNVTVKYLNDHDFETFLRKLCFRSLKCHIPGLKINGVVNCSGRAQTDYLNDLKFPEGYVSLEESAENILEITGLKEFTNISRGYKVSAQSNKVNNIDLEQIITRSDEQQLAGNITFHNLEVTSVLNVDGDIKGQGLEKLVPNIGLKDTMVIKANVDFLNLEVEGNIIIENNFNDTDVIKYFQDFLFKDEENVKINGNKTFPEGFTARKNLHIDSNLINEISLDSLITKDSSQDLHITSISRTTDFDHLYVTGLFDGQNINELNNTLIKLTENQTINSELLFLENLRIGNLALIEISNFNQEEESTDTKNVLSEVTETVLDNLDVEELEVEGNIIGAIDQVDLENFQENYLHYSKNQRIPEPYFAKKLNLHNFKPKKINDIELDAFSHKIFRDNITDFLLYRSPDIENLNVDGNINVETINDKDFGELVENDVWMKIFHNRSSKILTIEGDVYFETLQIENLADVDFDEYVSNLVFKNEADVDIENSIIFERGIRVTKIIETKTLNDVALENILRKEGDQTLLGQVEILGNVAVEDDLKVKEMINNVNVEYIFNNFDITDNSVKIKGEVMFQRMAYIQNLIINGTINGKDFDRIKSQFVYTNDDIDLEKNTFFNEMVHINGNFGITNDINGIVLSDFVSKVVWITKDSDIQGPVRFTRPVECFNFINVGEKLNTQYLFGKKLEEHVNNGVFVNKGLIKGLFNFDDIAINENLNTKFINDLDMHKIIPLKSDQEMESLELTEVVLSQDTNVGGKVSGVKLMEELQRTALKNVPQEIPSEVLFLNNVLIEDKLVASKINNKLTSKIVTTTHDQVLTASYSFNTKCWAEHHLWVYGGMINGINLTLWNNAAVPKYLENSQNIEEQWTVMEDLNLVGPVSGDGIMNGLNFTKLINEVQEKENHSSQIEKGIVEDYKNLCTDVTYIYENARNQIYKFKYFEELQKLAFFNPIHHVKYFEDKGKHYLLINRRENCLSHLMEFRQNGFYPIRDVHTGIISQVEVAKDKEDTFLIIRGDDRSKLECKIKFSTVVWRFKNQDLQVLAHFENQELIKESLLPLTFYGLRHGIVTEFKIEESSEIRIRRFRIWNVMNVTEDNAAFFPRGLKTGLALRTGKDMIFLNNDPIEDDEDYYDGEVFELDTEAVIPGTFRVERNFIVPGRVGGEVTIINVGVKGAKKNLLAVSSHKKARVEHRLDIIEIYIDPFIGELFDKIPAYRPSYLTSIEFENGETLLAFVEEQKVLQIYEYKGIEGFKHRSSLRIPASQMFSMELPIGENLTSRKVLGLVHQNGITLLQAVMMGNKIKDDLKCTLS